MGRGGVRAWRLGARDERREEPGQGRWERRWVLTEIGGGLWCLCTWGQQPVRDGAGVPQGGGGQVVRGVLMAGKAMHGRAS